MTYLPLTFPPGMVRPGTVYDARGRWYDGSCVRWHDGVLQPIGGWAGLTGVLAAQTGGAIMRGMHGWRKNDGSALVAFGSAAKLFRWDGSSLVDVTPSTSFTAGAADASGTYYSRTEATTWALDNFGEDLIAVSTADQELRVQDTSGAAAATTAPGSPACISAVVTPERFVVALGAGGDRRKIQWPDQESVSAWTPTATNQAGDLLLPGTGQIMNGKRGKGETLIWTDSELFALRYIGGSLVYGLTELGRNCGVISRHGMVVVDGRAFWMGPRGFFKYDGFVAPLDCPVADYVFNRIIRAQASKIYADVRTDFNEIWWYYPGTGTENSSVVVYNYKDDWWSVMDLVRTAGIDRGFFEYPIAFDALGNAYEHEKATTYQDVGGAAITPWVESGPFELGDGDTLMMIRYIIPDEETLGESRVYLKHRLYPTSTETTSSAFTLTNPTPIRITARQVRLKVEQVTAGWRWGTPRVEITPRGRR